MQKQTYLTAEVKMHIMQFRSCWNSIELPCIEQNNFDINYFCSKLQLRNNISLNISFFGYQLFLLGAVINKVEL